MIAVKEALSVPDAVFLPMVIVDTVWPYVWLGIIVALAGRQKQFDQWNHADRRILDDLAKRTVNIAQQKKEKMNPFKVTMMIALALAIGTICQQVSIYLPTGKNILTSYAWTIILVSTLAIFCSTTPLSRFAGAGANKYGKWILYFVLTSIGARASLSNAGQAGILLAAGMLVLCIHLIILLLSARLMRAPLFLVATASLSNIAGLVSAPMVAEVYQPGLASVGLLLAILGHCLGAYVGIFIAQVCRLFI